MNFQETEAVIAFKKLYRDKWVDLINSPMGSALLTALFSRRPLAITSNIEHNNHYQLGRVQQHNEDLALLAVELTKPLTDSNVEIPQNYPPEEENSEQKG